MMSAAALIVIAFAIFCCVTALWVIRGDRDGAPDTRLSGAGPLAGMSADALDLVERANRQATR